MAEKKDKQDELPVEGKPTTPIETETPAPEMDKTEPGGETDAPDENDISDVIEILKEIQSETGGSGEITSIPPELLGIVKFLIEKMATLKNSVCRSFMAGRS